MGRRAFLGAVAVAGSVGLAGVLIAMRIHVLNASSTGSRCRLGDLSFLQVRDLAQFGAFERDADAWQHAAPPLRGSVFAANQSPPPVFRDYVDGRLVGYLAETAITGPDRATEDAYARSVGYATGRLPLVPLQGTVVKNNPGLLEVYEDIWEFNTLTGAADMLSILRQNHGGIADMNSTPVPVRVGDDSVGYRMTPTSLDPQEERWVHLETRIGDTVLSVTAQGGTDLSTATAEALISTAARHFMTTCSTEN